MATEEISPEILEGIIETSKYELSAKILESLFCSRSPEILYSDFVEKVVLRYKGRIYYEEWGRSMDMLKELGLIEIRHKSPKVVKITPIGLESFRINKLLKRLVLKPLIDNFSEAYSLTEEEINKLTQETKRGYVEILESFRH